MNRPAKKKTDFIRIAPELDAGFALLPEGTDATGAGKTRIDKGEILEMHLNEYVRGMLSRGEFVRAVAGAQPSRPTSPATPPKTFNAENRGPLHNAADKE